MEVDGQPTATVTETQVIVENPSLDLEVYLSNYTGNTRIDRLVFIGDRCPQLRLDAYKLALKELSETHDTKRLLAVSEKLRETQKKAGLPLHNIDHEMIANLERQTAQKTDKLDQELKNYKNNLIKESIRMGYNDLGDHYYRRGDLQNALKCYMRTRDYCTTSKHIIQMCLNVIRVSIETGNYASVITYTKNALATADIKKESLVVAKLNAAAALYHLDRRDYKQAALKFIETSFEINSMFSDVISAQDIGIYGGLCSLASFDRTELRTNVINNQSFRQFLELAPEVRGLIENFINARYAACLSFIERIKPDLLLDLHLHDHVDALFANIRKKSLIQYFSPFLSVDLHKMAAAFAMTIDKLEAELTSLIMDKEIQARIDSHNKILYARQTDQRTATFQRAIATGTDYERQTKLAILRLNMCRANFIVKNDKDKQKEDERDRSQVQPMAI